jgi:hypothetical protein
LLKHGHNKSVQHQSEEELLFAVLLHALLLEVEVVGQEGVLVVEHVLELVVETVVQARLVVLHRLSALRPLLALALLLFLLHQLLLHAGQLVEGHQLPLCRVDLRQQLELIDDLQSFGVFFGLIQFGVLPEALEVGPQHANTIKEMRLELEAVLLAQS